MRKILVAFALACLPTGISYGQLPVEGKLFPDHPIYGRFDNQFMLSATCELQADVLTDCWQFAPSIIDWEQFGVVTVVSTSVQDSSSGTGAGSIRLFGFDSDGLFQAEILSLNGTSNVVSNLEFKSPIAVLQIDSPGSSGDAFNYPTADGIITATINGVNAGIIDGFNQSMNAATRVELNRTAVVIRLTFTTEAAVGGSSGDVRILYLSKNGGLPPFVQNVWFEVLPPITIPTSGEFPIQIDGIVANTSESIQRFLVISTADVDLRIAFLANVYKK